MGPTPLFFNRLWPKTWSCWQEWRGSNPRPSVLETDALPTELHSCVQTRGYKETGRPVQEAVPQEVAAAARLDYWPRQRGYSLVVKLQPSKLAMRVRFPLPAPSQRSVPRADRRRVGPGQAAGFQASRTASTSAAALPRPLVSVAPPKPPAPAAVSGAGQSAREGQSDEASAGADGGTGSDANAARRCPSRRYRPAGLV